MNGGIIPCRVFIVFLSRINLNNLEVWKIGTHLETSRKVEVVESSLNAMRSRSDPSSGDLKARPRLAGHQQPAFTGSVRPTRTTPVTHKPIASRAVESQWIALFPLPACAGAESA
jgi:hypothetical protein